MKEIDGIRLYRLTEVARMLEVSPATIRSYIKRGKIRAVKVGRAFEIADSNLREFLTNSREA